MDVFFLSQSLFLDPCSSSPSSFELRNHHGGSHWSTFQWLPQLVSLTPISFFSLSWCLAVPLFFINQEIGSFWGSSTAPSKFQHHLKLNGWDEWLVFVIFKLVRFSVLERDSSSSSKNGMEDLWRLGWSTELRTIQKKLESDFDSVQDNNNDHKTTTT